MKIRPRAIKILLPIQREINADKMVLAKRAVMQRFTDWIENKSQFSWSLKSKGLEVKNLKPMVTFQNEGEYQPLFSDQKTDITRISPLLANDFNFEIS